MTRRDSVRRGATCLLGATACALALALSCSREEKTPPTGPTGGGAAIERPAAPAPAPPPASATAPAPAGQDTAAGSAETREELVERGHRVYLANCIACHAQDPNMAGGLGPPIAGSSRALIEARVLHAAYPPGYVPKRDTKIMIALPHLANDIDALHAYLAAAKAK